MRLATTLHRLHAIPCPACHGHGITHGVFHRFECATCGGAGAVTRVGGRRLDALATGVIARAKAADEAARQNVRAARLDFGTPDKWRLVNNYRGD